MPASRQFATLLKNITPVNFRLNVQVAMALLSLSETMSRRFVVVVTMRYVVTRE